MDQVKIGAFIAQLRREKGWTQEELGERLGITNKTVSRWENGNYMPGIEMLSLLGKEFGVSLNELVEGRRLEEADFRAAADRNLATALERPMDKLRRWLERYGMFALVVALLCLIIVGIAVRYTQYYQAHPLDARTPSSFRNYPENPMDILYFTFSYDGRYYIFTPTAEYLEIGDYSRDGDLITLDNGKSVRWVVVKGHTIRDVDPRGGGVLTYELLPEYHGVSFLIGPVPSHNIAP